METDLEIREFAKGFIGDINNTTSATMREVIVEAIRKYQDKTNSRAQREALEAIADFWGDHPVPLSPHALLMDSDTLEIRTQVREALGRKA